MEAAIEIYGRMSTDLLPTPTKSHYVFNLRDLSKCVQGILRADPGVIREQVRLCGADLMLKEEKQKPQEISKLDVSTT